MNHLSILKEAPCHPLVRDYLLDAVERYGEKDAFVLKDQSAGKTYYRHVSYYTFWQEARELGQGLCALGLSGKRVAVIGENSYEWILTYLAVLCGVGVIVPLDRELKEPEIRLSLERSGADAVVFDEKHAPLMEKLSGETDRIYLSTKKIRPGFKSIKEVRELGALSLPEQNDFDTFSPDPDAIASIIFTSGTTSSAKAVMLSNRNIAANLYDLLRVEELFPEDRNLVFLPLHHTFGSVGLTYFLCSGTTNMFCDGLRYVQKNLKEYKITTFVCVPLLLEVMYRNLLRGIEKKGKKKAVERALKLSRSLLKRGIDVRRKLFRSLLDELGGELRFIISGASAIRKEVAQGFNDFGILTVQGYGLTETSPVLTAENPGNIRYGSVGKAFPGVELSILDPDENGIGEICAKGENVMLGYYEMPEETAAVLQNGVFRTGDLGRIDEDGFLYITGRKKNVLVMKNGKNIYPEEIEELIGALPFVSEVMVYGKKKEDDLLLSAKIVYARDYLAAVLPGGSEEDFAAYMKNEIVKINDALPPYKHVKNLTFQTQGLIKTSTAKVKRYEELAKED